MTTTIAAPPPAPNRATQTQAEFIASCDAWLSWQELHLVPGIQAIRDEVAAMVAVVDADALTANTQAGIAAGHVATALGHANTADGHRLAAAGSATAAAGSATTAAQRLADVEALYDQFDDRYLGVKASDPALDNDGNALQAGAIYVSSTTGALRVYTGSAWVQGLASVAGVTSLNGQTGDVTIAAGTDPTALLFYSLIWS